MKVFAMFLILVMLISTTNAQNESKLKKVTIVKEKTVYVDSLTLEKIPKFKCNNITVENGDSVKFISTAQTVPLLIIIPKVDSLFSNYDEFSNDSNYTVQNINGIIFLFIYLNEEHSESETFSLYYHDPERNADKSYYYRYSVYIINANAMAEGKSSPEIIVEP